MRLDPQHPRLGSSAETDRKHSPKHDRHLTEDVARQPLPNNTLDSINEPHSLDPALKDSEEGTIIALVGCVLARHKPDIRSHTRKPLLLVRVEHRENLDLGDLLRRHHDATSCAMPLTIAILLAS